MDVEIVKASLKINGLADKTATNQINPAGHALSPTSQRNIHDIFNKKRFNNRLVSCYLCLCVARSHVILFFVFYWSRLCRNAISMHVLALETFSGEKYDQT